MAHVSYSQNCKSSQIRIYLKDNLNLLQVKCDLNKWYKVVFCICILYLELLFSCELASFKIMTTPLQCHYDWKWLERQEIITMLRQDTPGSHGGCFHNFGMWIYHCYHQPYAKISPTKKIHTQAYFIKIAEKFLKVICF